MTDGVKHTKRQLANWRRYEKVRQKGSWNMYELNARLATGLSSMEYQYCMRHYGTLKQQSEGDIT